MVCVLKDGITLYTMDRLLFRLGRSRHRKEFSLKGGVLASHLMKVHSRHTRDIDLERRHGPPDPDAHKAMFEDVIAVSSDDGIEFSRVQAWLASRDHDGYDGILIKIQGRLYNTELEVKVDIGLVDAVRPPPQSVRLTPYLEGDQPPQLLAYGPEPFIAEKVETILGKYPLIQHRLKDIYDVVRLSRFHDFEEDKAAAIPSALQHIDGLTDEEKDALERYQNFLGLTGDVTTFFPNAATQLWSTYIGLLHAGARRRANQSKPSASDDAATHGDTVRGKIKDTLGDNIVGNTVGEVAGGTTVLLSALATKSRCHPSLTPLPRSPPTNNADARLNESGYAHSELWRHKLLGGVTDNSDCPTQAT